jgi:hypothetical protein
MYVPAASPAVAHAYVALVLYGCTCRQVLDEPGARIQNS